MLVFGGWCDEMGPKAAVQCYDTRADCWSLLGDTKAPNSIGTIPKRVYAGCVAVRSKLYLIGGYDGDTALKSTLCYDMEIDSGWTEINCMYEKRYYVSVAHRNGYIYAIGGHNGENSGRLNTAERLDIQDNIWKTIAPMNKVRSDASATALYEFVYVCGGFEGSAYHSSAEYYDPNVNQWTLIADMRKPRGGVSLASVNGYIYAIGGNDGQTRVKTIEKYDPVEDSWSVVSQMSRKKSNLSTTVVNHCIYIIGGWSDEPDTGILDSVEKFDTYTGTCTDVCPLRFKASATCSCTVYGREIATKYINRSYLPNPVFELASIEENYI